MALADASQAWINAKNELSRYRQNYLDSAPSVRPARDRVAAIEQSRRELIARFEIDLSNDPNLRRLGDAAGAEQQCVAQAAAALNAINEQIAQLQNESARLGSVLVCEQTRLAQADRDAGYWQGLLNQSTCD